MYAIMRGYYYYYIIIIIIIIIIITEHNNLFIEGQGLPTDFWFHVRRTYEQNTQDLSVIVVTYGTDIW